MVTNVTMASNASILLGAGEIQSFTDVGTSPETMNAIYQKTKEQLLSYHPWKFALKEQDLSRLSEAPDTKTRYTYQFVLPTDNLRLWEIQPRGNYEIVGNTIYSNQTELRAVYVYDVAESQLPSYFQEVLEYKLAHKAAMPITEDINKSDYWGREADQAMARATFLDSQSAPQVPIQSEPFIEAR